MWAGFALCTCGDDLPRSRGDSSMPRVRAERKATGAPEHRLSACPSRWLLNPRRAIFAQVGVHQEEDGEWGPEWLEARGRVPARRGESDELESLADTARSSLRPLDTIARRGAG